MKEEIKNELMKRSLEYLDKAEAFASKEVPAFLKELMEFKFVEHLATGAINVISSIIIMSVFTGLFVLCIDRGGAHDKSVADSLLIALMTFFIAVAFNSDEFINAYKAKTAPRVYLMDYIKKNN